MLPPKDAFSDDEGVDDTIRLPTINKLRRLRKENERLREENEKLRNRNAEIDAMGQVLQGDVLAQVKRTSFSGGRWLFVLSLLMVVGSASASSDGASELQKCGDNCTFWLDTNKMMFKTGGPCTCSHLYLSNKGIAKIANGTVSDMPNLQELFLEDNDITELEPGWVSNVPNLDRLYLHENKIVKLANGTVSDMLNLQYLSLFGNEIAELEPGWVSNVPRLQDLLIYANKIAKLSKGTVSDMPNLKVLFLYDNEIAELEPGWVSNAPSLEHLDIYDNPLGCVSGVADDVAIDSYASFWFVGSYETPRCPENCTINTYYDADNHVCLACPENTYTDGIGGVNCTALAAAPTTTTPAPLCDGETRPFFHAGATLCVPKDIHPVGALTELSSCGSECTFWLDTNKMMFKTGGPCTCSISYLFIHFKGIVKIANGTVNDIQNLEYLALDQNEITELEPGSVRNLPRLSSLFLSNNKITKIAKGTIVDMPNLQYLYLHDNEIAELEPGWVINTPNLERLEIYDNPLGCVSGIADDVEIDTRALENGFYETPRCPENCTINTYYDPDNHVCLSCPENTYRNGIGAVNCTALAATTTTPAPLCDGEARPFSLAGDTLCVPNSLYPAPNVVHCVFEGTWADVVEHKHLYKTGGLGKKMRDVWKVWVCMEHACATDKTARVCFTFSEEHRVFVPWGYNSQLRVLKM